MRPASQRNEERPDQRRSYRGRSRATESETGSHDRMAAEKTTVPIVSCNLLACQGRVAEDMLFLDDRVVLPKSLQKEMLALLRESHMGIEKTKARATNALYWPGMSDDREKTVVNCSISLHHRNTQPKEPLNPHPVPEIVWQKVGSRYFYVPSRGLPARSRIL